jgi:poly(A) polymerase
MTERLPPQPWMAEPAAVRVLDALEAAGGRDCARFVGGAVRNTLMGLPVADVDIATKLTPEAVTEALKKAKIKAVPTGVEHGTVTAVCDHKPYEITTLRRDVETDGRRAVVAFTTDWAEDAQRRDFRLNALFADRAGVVHDYVGGGIEDAHAGRVVFVGDAETRIREDYLRILRFFRFFAWYGKGEVHQSSVDACVALKEGLKTLSGERVSKELLKTFEALSPVFTIGFMIDSGVMAEVLPYPLDFTRFARMVAMEPDPVLRLSALGPDDAAQILDMAKRLRLSNEQRDRLVEAAAPPPIDLAMDERASRALRYRIGDKTFHDRVLRAFAGAPTLPTEAGGLLETAMKAGKGVFEPLGQWTPPAFPLTGADVKALGLVEGPDVGRLLRAVEDWWVAEDFPATGLREKLAELAKR